MEGYATYPREERRSGMPFLHFLLIALAAVSIGLLVFFGIGYILSLGSPPTSSAPPPPGAAFVYIAELPFQPVYLSQ